MRRMSAATKVQVSWLVNVILVPVCAFFLTQTYFAIKEIGKGQVYMQVEQAKQGVEILRLQVDVNTLNNKVDRINDD